ncbi:MAG TPA: pyridoxal-phosphate dependent enzyme [Solirubrobacteraceae bacterium]|jgi:threonine dehydratase|nr:pyridoxal-phosphate dependent enzyme [Solirubrobacteraceae bacterium]
MKPGDAVGSPSSGQRSAAELIARADLDGARRAVLADVLRTPTIACASLSEAAGTAVALKAECLQRTGSFKLRGALSKVAALGDHAASGLVTASAGNHARAVAQAALLRGVSCEVFMPRDAPVSKVVAVERLGASVELDGESVEEALGLARQRAEGTGAALVHPFDDLDVIAGQGTLGLELLEDVPDLARVVVPVGGGGLASGIGIALRRAGVEVELVGVQARTCAPYVRALGGDADGLEAAVGATIADGIAIKRPGELTLALLRELLSGVETVSEEQIAEAMVFLAEDAKLVAEGAGAVAVAALLDGHLAPVAGTTVAIVSGGNVDSGLLASLLLRHETEEGRRVRIFTRVPDRPGGLAELLELVARTRANLVSVGHVREATPLHVRETGIELTLETRGPGHTEELLAALEGAGYDVRAA